MRELKVIIALFTCSYLPMAGYAQVNLVKNPSFEQYNICPHIPHGVVYANYWTAISDTGLDPSVLLDSFGTSIPVNYCFPQYFNECDDTIADPSHYCTLPDNEWFNHYPRTGRALMAARMYFGSTDIIPFGDVQYLQGRLYSVLVAGQSYCVTFYVLGPESSTYASNNIGAYLDDGSIDTTTDCGLPQTMYVPQVVENAVINDTANWIKIQGSFTATGTERFITIGNFFDTAHTTHIYLDPGHVSSDAFAFYLVDDVSVIASNAQAYAGPDQTITIGSSAYLGVDSNGDGMPCYWYVYGETAPIDSGGAIKVNPLVTTTYVVSMDLCGVVTYDTVTVTVLPCPGTPVASFTHSAGAGGAVNFTYTGTTTSLDSVVWNFGDGGRDTGLTAQHTYAATDTYHVCVTVYTYCGRDSMCGSVTLGVKPLTPKGEPLIWPNPVGNELIVRDAAGSVLYIYDVVGEEKIHTALINDKEVIDVSKIPGGIYVVQITDPSMGQRTIKKIVKE